MMGVDNLGSAVDTSTVGHAASDSERDRICGGRPDQVRERENYVMSI